MVCARADALVERDGTGLKAIDALPGPVIPDGLGPSTSANGDPPKTPTTPGDVHILEGATSAETHNHPEPRHSSHAWVGISLILGFILMYLIDTLPSLKPPAPPQRMNIYSLSDLASNSPSTPMRSTLPKGSFSTTLGLVIHAAADGIALGASSSQPSLSFIIFLAIMVHKAPAAFGLTSVLLKQGVGKRVARTHLVAFSLAAPCGALFTWIIAHILGGDGEGPGSEENMRWWTGVLLLFSAGTFL
jgi:zinc transporter 9